MAETNNFSTNLFTFIKFKFIATNCETSRDRVLVDDENKFWNQLFPKIPTARSSDLKPFDFRESSLSELFSIFKSIPIKIFKHLQSMVG